MAARSCGCSAAGARDSGHGGRSWRQVVDAEGLAASHTVWVTVGYEGLLGKRRQQALVAASAASQAGRDD